MDPQVKPMIPYETNIFDSNYQTQQDTTNQQLKPFGEYASG